MDDDKIDMGDIKHQGEDEDMTNIENNPKKERKRRKDQEDVDRGYGNSSIFNKKKILSSFLKITILPSRIH